MRINTAARSTLPRRDQCDPSSDQHSHTYALAHSLTFVPPMYILIPLCRYAYLAPKHLKRQFADITADTVSMRVCGTSTLFWAVARLPTKTLHSAPPTVDTWSALLCVSSFDCQATLTLTPTLPRP
jgi:hypothetical protein